MFEKSRQATTPFSELRNPGSLRRVWPAKEEKSFYSGWKLERLIGINSFSKIFISLPLQKYDSDLLNPTDLRRRLEQVSNSKKVPTKEMKEVQKQKKSNERINEVQAGDKTEEERPNMETSKSALNPITEKLEDIAEKIDKERIESEAKWEKSQRELEEVNFLLFMMSSWSDNHLVIT